MADLENMTPGQVMADANVSEFIKSMGLSIAEAQKALDLNSLAQIGAYAEARPGLNDKSLLQLGLSPPFYHYQYADLMVSMHLSMKVGKSDSFGLAAHLDVNNGTPGANAKALQREAKISLTGTKGSVSVGNNNKINKIGLSGEDIRSVAENLASALRTPGGKFERVYVAAPNSKDVPIQLDPANATNPVTTRNAVAFLSNEGPATALLRIKAEPQSMDGKETFQLNQTTTIDVATLGDVQKYALDVAKAIRGSGDGAQFDAQLIGEGDEGLFAPAANGRVGIVLFGSGSDAITPHAAEALGVIAAHLKTGKIGRVKVTGYTDLQGTVESNSDLARRRAKAVADHLEHLGVDAGAIDIESVAGEKAWIGARDGAKNEHFRRAEIVLLDQPALFIVVTSKGDAKLDPNTPASSNDGSRFISVVQSESGKLATKIIIDGNGVLVPDIKTPKDRATRFANAVNGEKKGVQASAVGSVVYLSDAKASVELDLLTLSGDDIALSATDDAEIIKPLASVKPAGASEAPKDDKAKQNIGVAVGVSIDYRTSRMFETSINGNSSISARLVSVPAPVEFLDSIKKYLATEPPKGGPSK